MTPGWRILVCDQLLLVIAVLLAVSRNQERSVASQLVATALSLSSQGQVQTP